jgi:hypothetical protein
MKDLLNILKSQNKEQDFDAIRVGLASPEKTFIHLRSSSNIIRFNR